MQCQSVARAHACVAKVSQLHQCMWPDFACPHTPTWQLFSTCLHRDDALLASLWHDVHAPFSVPCNLQEGHVCSFRKLDHHLCGCVTCGSVHRCDTQQWYTAEPATSQQQLSRLQRRGRCPTVSMPDGSVVCSITGVCIREVSFCPGYTGQPGTQGHLRNSRLLPAPGGTAGITLGDRVVDINVVDNDQLTSSLWEILCVVCKEQSLLYSKYTDICDKRNTILHQLLSSTQKETGQPVCLIRMAASLEAGIHTLHKAEATQSSSSGGIFSYVDPYAALVPKPDAVIHSIVKQVQPYIFRLILVIKTWDPSKCKKGCMRSV